MPKLPSVAPGAIVRPRAALKKGVACSAIVQSLPHAVIVLDDEQRVMLANRAAALLFRQPAARLHGSSISAIVPHHDIAALLHDFGAQRTKIFETTLPAARPHKPPITLKITAVMLRNWTIGARRVIASEAARPEFRLLLLEDISDVATLEQQLVETEKQAAVGQLAAGLLHEVSNPLTSLGTNLCFAREALTRGASHEVTQALDISLDQLELMRQLLGTLSGFPVRTQPRYGLADMHDVLRASLAFIARDAERRRISIALSLTPALLMCEMDVRLIKQVLLNLLKNAMEAMPDGGELHVKTASREAATPDAATVVVEISDTGVGITESDLRRVFRPLFTTKPRGVGLGLSFCRQAVEEHGGEIHLSSGGKDQGVTATFSLPVRQLVTEE